MDTQRMPVAITYDVVEGGGRSAREVIGADDFRRV